MPRVKQPRLDEQVYKLPQYGPHATVTIRYDASRPLPFYQPAPGVVIVGHHECARQDAQQGAIASAGDGTPGGATMDDVVAFRARREAPVKRPLRSEDIAREQGFNPDALSFEHISGIAAAMAPPGESPVE